MSNVFYLKYRPQKINELDLKNVRESLKKIFSSKSIPHAFLFAGPKGLGKTSAARIVAKTVNCETRNTQKKKKNAKHAKIIEPCNKCSICKGITSGTSLDLIEIDGASNRGIDDIRNLKERIKLSPTQSRKKVYVIDEVHMLTNEAFNALLKTLEEPPEHALFILCTTQPEKLPPTIISRCQRIDFNLAKEEEIVRSLKRIVKGEKLKINEKVLKLIAKNAEGSFRDAAKILQKLTFDSKKITLKKAKKELQKEQLLAKELIREINSSKQRQALKIISKAVKRGIDLKFFTQQILYYLRDILFQHLGVVKKSTNLNLTKDQITKLIDLFDEAGRNLRGSQIPQLNLEMAVIDYFKKPGKIKEKSQKKNISSISTLQEKWQKTLELVKQDNHSIEALLKSTKPVKIKNNKLVIQVFYEFHNKELNKKNKKRLVERRVKQVFGAETNIKYKIK